MRDHRDKDEDWFEVENEGDVTTSFLLMAVGIFVTLAVIGLSTVIGWLP